MVLCKCKRRVTSASTDCTLFHISLFSLQVWETVDCKTVPDIFAYSSTGKQSHKRSRTRLKTVSETGERRQARALRARKTLYRFLYWFWEKNRLFCSQGRLRNFCLWNPESWDLESGIQFKKSGIPVMIGIRNLSSSNKASGIQDCLGFPYMGWLFPRV